MKKFALSLFLELVAAEVVYKLAIRPVVRKVVYR